MKKIRQWLLGFITYRQAERLRNFICGCLLYSGAAWLLGRMRTSGATILVYHSIGGVNVFADNVLPTREFERQMRFLARRRVPVPLERIVEAVRSGQVPHPAWVAVTFDDGYRDFLTEALPVLRRYNITASMFVPTTVLDGSALFIDEIEQMIATTTLASIRVRTSRGDEFIPIDDASRQDASLRVALICREMDPAERSVALQDLRTQCRDTVAVKSDYLRPADVAVGADTFEVGSHSIHHYSLARLDDSTLHRELAESRSRLRQLSAQEVGVLAYPFGKPWSFDERVKRAALHAGYRAALTTLPGYVGRHADPMALPRIGAGWGLARLRLNLMGITL